MKAVVIPRHGGPEVLGLTDVADPQIAANEVLVRVRACALNHLDLWVRNGLPGIHFPLPLIPGSDVAGEVAAIGPQVTGVSVGQKVVLAPGISCGACAACAAGTDNFCRKYTVLGYGVNGGYAEYVKAPVANVLAMPEGLSFEEAAAVPLVFMTAWHMLIARAHLQSGDDVLVLAAGSGVGSAAIQIAKLMGARVMTTVGSAEKIAKAKALGADEVVDRTKQKISDEVRRWTARRGVDIVFEHVGEATWDESVASLAVGGRLVTCGATTGANAKFNLKFLFAKQQSILGSFMGSRAELYSVLKLVGAGKLHPVVDRILPLAEARAAHEWLESGGHFGKIVLAI
jgi:NADPH:quinone reductase-like Zn-dependent oxidoreductase